MKCSEDGYKKKVCTPCSAGEEETGTDVCGCPICEEKCPEFNGCSSCEIETEDENGCPICESNCAGSCEVCENGSCVDYMTTKKGGFCCDEDVACCPLTEDCSPVTGCIVDSSCTDCASKGGTMIPTLVGDCCDMPIMCCSADETCQTLQGCQAAECCPSCGATLNCQSDSDCNQDPERCEECFIHGKLMNGEPAGWCVLKSLNLTPGEISACLTVVGCDKVSKCDLDTEACIEGNCCLKDKVCGEMCCGDNFTCVSGNCCSIEKACNESCCGETEACIEGICCAQEDICSATCCPTPNKCINGLCCDTPNTDATECCSYGVGVDGECCPIDPNTCTIGSYSDENGCTVCCLPVQDCPNGTIKDENGCVVCKEGCDEDTQHSCTNGTDTWCCNNGQSCGSNKGECNSCGNVFNNYCFKSRDTDSCTAENSTICQNCGYDLALVGVLDDAYPEYRTEIYGCGGQKSCSAGETWKLDSNEGKLGYGCVPNSYVACCDYRYNWDGDNIVSVTSYGFRHYAPSADDCYSEDPDIGYTAACN